MDTTEVDELWAKMAPALRALLVEPRQAVSAGTSWPKAAGVYAIFEGDECLYVGRTRDVRARMRSHCAESSTHHSASFAFRLARAKLKYEPATYRTEGGRSDLAGRPEFDAEFRRQRRRVGAMLAAFIELTDDDAQALFEIYAAKCLRAEHSKFRTT
jgi:hypothetical protein